MGGKFCVSCGAERQVHHRFCISCGSGFEEIEQIAPQSDDVDIHHLADEEGEYVSQEWAEDGEASTYTSGGLPKAIVGLVIAAMLALGGWYLWQNSEGETVTALVTGPANVRNMPTTEGSSVIRQLNSGDQIQGQWVQGTTDPGVRWLKLSGVSEAQYVWEGNLKIVEPTGMTSASSGGLRQNLVGEWSCSSTIMGAEEKSNIRFGSDGSLTGRSTLSGVVEGQPISSETHFNGSWEVKDDTLIEDISSYEVRNFRWTNTFLDALFVAELKEAQTASPLKSEIDFRGDRMRLMYEIDGLLAPVDCNRSSTAQSTSRANPISIDRNSPFWSYRDRVNHVVNSAPNFDQDATIAEWGCRPGCQSGVVVDRVTGVIAWLPVGGENTPSFQANYRQGNNLMLASWEDEFAANGQVICGYSAFRWRGSSFAELQGYPIRVKPPGQDWRASTECSDALPYMRELVESPTGTGDCVYTSIVDCLTEGVWDQ